MRSFIPCVLLAFTTGISAAVPQQSGSARPPGGRSAARPERSADDAQRFLSNLQESSRPSQVLGTFAWPDHKVTISDVGFKLEESADVRCYWFGQVDSIQVEAGRRVLAWRRDDIRPIVIAATGGNRGDFPKLGGALRTAHRAWGAKYKDVAARMKSVGGAGRFAQLATQARQGWYDEGAKTVACDDGFAPRTTAQLPAGLSIGSRWVGTIDSGAAELQITGASSATMKYHDVTETLELQIGTDGEIVFRGVAYELNPGVNRIFRLDIFRGRLSADQQTISGTWTDAGIGKGKWSVSRAKP
jgi:hypothetical protein